MSDNAEAADADADADAAAVDVGIGEASSIGIECGCIVHGKWLVKERKGRGAFGEIFVVRNLQPQSSNQTQIAAAARDPDEDSDTDTSNSSRSGIAEQRYYAMKVERLQSSSKATVASTPYNPIPILTPTPTPAPAPARSVLKLESYLLSKLQPHNTFSRFIEYGKDTNLGIAYMVMELLGENLLKLKKNRKTQTQTIEQEEEAEELDSDESIKLGSGHNLNSSRKKSSFSWPTVLRFGMQAIRAIQAVHSIGFLHRDVKPSNFVIGPSRSTASRIYLIDFGLAKSYLSRSSPPSHLPPRTNIAGFRGTPRYASIHVHRGEDLSRRDDLWSLLYILVEFVRGRLPWEKERDKQLIGEWKEKYHIHHRLVKRCGRTLKQFMNYVEELGFYDEPDYDYLYGLLEEKFKTIQKRSRMDWEEQTLPHTTLDMSNNQFSEYSIKQSLPAPQSQQQQQQQEQEQEQEQIEKEEMLTSAKQMPERESDSKSDLEPEPEEKKENDQQDQEQVSHQPQQLVESLPCNNPSDDHVSCRLSLEVKSAAGLVLFPRAPSIPCPPPFRPKQPPLPHATRFTRKSHLQLIHKYAPHHNHTTSDAILTQEAALQQPTAVVVVAEERSIEV